jgi:L-rhamnose mutarotase
VRAALLRPARPLPPMAQRICFQLQVRPEHIAAYRARHAAVWPEMRAALTQAGWRNYSLFISPAGLVIGVCEVDDFDAARSAMEQTEVNARWQREMAPFFEGLGDRRPDQGLALLDEIFHLA